MGEKNYEEISEVDIAYEILSNTPVDEEGKHENIFYKDLIIEILDKKNKAVQNEATAISEVYTMINMDSRFQYVGEGMWELLEWNPPEVKRGRGGRTKVAGKPAEKTEEPDA